MPAALSKKAFELARVLLVDDDLTSRLTLKAVLEAGGYCVDSAASAAEGVEKLVARQYELVLSDLHMESPEAGLAVLARARSMDYKPATAILTTYSSRLPEGGTPVLTAPVLIEPEDLPALLDKVADLISFRAAQIVERQMRRL
jgi:CheY-like chemotaxis protein